MKRKTTRRKKKTVKRHGRIIKRAGHLQYFDERKLYASIFSACLATHLSQTKAETVAGNVCKDIKRWIKSRKNVTSDQIFREAAKAMRRYNRDAAFMYATHRDIS